MVGLRGGEALQVGEREGVLGRFDAGDADDPGWGVGGMGEEGGQRVGEEVVPEDVGAEDLAKGWFWSCLTGR